MGFHEIYVFIIPNARNGIEKLRSLDTTSVYVGGGGGNFKSGNISPQASALHLSVNTLWDESSRIDPRHGENPPSWRAPHPLVFSRPVLLLVPNHLRLIKNSMPIQTTK